jgi:hypothetical protein
MYQQNRKGTKCSDIKEIDILCQELTLRVKIILHCIISQFSVEVAYGHKQRGL